jgi:hypothetical protein
VLYISRANPLELIRLCTPVFFIHLHAFITDHTSNIYAPSREESFCAQPGIISRNRLLSIRRLIVLVFNFRLFFFPIVLNVSYSNFVGRLSTECPR